MGKPIRQSKIHILGVAYKRDIDDIRESPALDIMHILQRRGAILSYSDSYVPKVSIEGIDFRAQDLLPSIEEADCVVVGTDHSSLDYSMIVDRCKLIFDSRNALKGIQSPKILKL